MSLTRPFIEIVKDRIKREPAFRDALLAEAVDCFLTGDVQTGKAMLRNYINATIGFQKLAAATGTPPKSLMRMFGPSGNPNAENLFSVLRHLQRLTRVQLHVLAGA